MRHGDLSKAADELIRIVDGQVRGTEQQVGCLPRTLLGFVPIKEDIRTCWRQFDWSIRIWQLRVVGRQLAFESPFSGC